ncbi:MAG: putative bifunctional diguanylate cyclase/phosphodiesterase, partial [Solirubrobacteraceae bacterium]
MPIYVAQSIPTGGSQVGTTHDRSGQQETDHETGTESSGDEQLRQLGRLLYERRDEVVARAERLNREGALQLDALAHRSIARVITVSTEAVSRWMAGEGVDTAREVGREAAAIFGQLAIQRDAPLAEISKRALRWRDVSWQVITEIAGEHALPLEVQLEAQRMLQRSLDVTLVRLGEAFEADRNSVDRELERRQQELEFLATHDPLTGLPNRTLILDRAEQLLARARREQIPCGALSIDLDGFKAINDSLGHRAGDTLLQAIAMRLGSAIRGADALGRLGGDQFVILVEGLALAAGPELVAERILDALGQPFALAQANNGRVSTTASIGIACGDYDAPVDLLRDADIAMYRAKLAGKNRYAVFEVGMQAAAHTRAELEMDIRDAVTNEAFQLAYQPMFDLDGLRPVRMEALLRWCRPSGESVGPGEFIPILERSGLIAEAGRWVLHEACRQSRAWVDQGLAIGVAVNVSAVQLEQDRFVDDVVAALEQSGLDPAALTIEITETALMRDAEATAARLRAIKELGVRLSIDDFGTGYSSLSYLQRFPVDELKIDRSFVAHLADGTDGDA